METTSVTNRHRFCWMVSNDIALNVCTHSIYLLDALDKMSLISLVLGDDEKCELCFGKGTIFYSRF